MATTTSITNYGVSVGSSIEKGIRSKYKRKVGLAFPLVRGRRVVVTGGILRISKVIPASCFGGERGQELIKNNLHQLIKTEKGERVMLPDYGLALSKYIFEPLDETTYELIKEDILTNIRKYFSIARVIKLSVLADPSSTDGNQLLIKLTIQILDESLDIFDIEAKVG